MNASSYHSRPGSRRVGAWVALAGASAGALATTVTFTQPLDGWWENRYTWQAQKIELKFAHDGTIDVGKTKPVCFCFKQADGSQVMKATTWCVTATKLSHGDPDKWSITIPPGEIEDSDWWDASRIEIELVEIISGKWPPVENFSQRYGRVQWTDYASPAGVLEPQRRLLAGDGSQWDWSLVVADGYHFTEVVYAAPGGPIPLVHLDEVGITGQSYGTLDPFGTGAPIDHTRLVLVGVQLDSWWDYMPYISNGLHDVQWDLVNMQLITDQGTFDILRFDQLSEQTTIVGCHADYNGDGFVDGIDSDLFNNDFESGAPAADYSLDGFIDGIDSDMFNNDFEIGC